MPAQRKRKKEASRRFPKACRLRGFEASKQAAATLGGRRTKVNQFILFHKDVESIQAFLLMMASFCRLMTRFKE